MPPPPPQKTIQGDEKTKGEKNVTRGGFLVQIRLWHRVLQVDFREVVTNSPVRTPKCRTQLDGFMHAPNRNSPNLSSFYSCDKYDVQDEPASSTCHVRMRAAAGSKQTQSCKHYITDIALGAVCHRSGNIGTVWLLISLPKCSLHFRAERVVGDIEPRTGRKRIPPALLPQAFHFSLIFQGFHASS